jgi:uncharacterized protein DUF5985
MPGESISATVKRLIAESIDSVPELETILLLRETRDHDWTVAEAGERLYVSKTVAAHVLATLADKGFFVSDGERYLSFFVEAVNRVALALSEHPNEGAPIFYGVRLLAYLLILLAVVDKNRAERAPR